MISDEVDRNSHLAALTRRRARRDPSAIKRPQDDRVKMYGGFEKFLVAHAGYPQISWIVSSLEDRCEEAVAGMNARNRPQKIPAHELIDVTPDQCALCF